MKKAFIALLISVLLIPNVFAGTFDDVVSSDENYVAIEYLVSIGTLQGYSDGIFQPDTTINRAELMKVLVAGQGISPDENTYKDCYSDVASDWYAKYVCYATEQGWVGGYPDGTFKPAQTVNKVEALKMLVNALGLGSKLPETVSEDLFDDTDNSAWYAPYLYVAKDLNLLEVTDRDYGPSSDMNRGGVAEYIFRTLVVNELLIDSYTAEYRDQFLTDKGLSSLIETPVLYDVDYVVDGDTIRLTDGQYVRLLGIDTPETDECYYDEAKAYLEGLIGDNQVELVADEINDDKDAYDRLLRYIYVNDELVNLTMVEDGYAEYYDSYDITLADDFDNAEGEASLSGLGLWTACFDNTSAEVVDGLYISYVLYDGDVPDVESDEYVEITNGSVADIDLTDYYIMGSSGDEKFTFSDYTLASGEAVKVYTNQGDISFGVNKAIWSNSGETVYLYGPENVLVDSFIY
ncbi:MAG: S-layer protein [uncultured bacterium]|nr:MAG: S-layer protein [uncultured bacterium]OGJ47430.1 MAG: hypothetical protein A2244_01710 [Candidatus Peregrinibacteria bacterium RIFOXYA2_FULL_41_18]OGJ49458.1 MAG: hypothetical protein A2344_00300 [Candidatus Peregrinibacteria bacterium RIFOXYB12_FULL_41_12]OGJ53359.1 MAG: hypothetical protein A2448_01315 [Candidatus Peregrinibacteria bacterium RIFOXYC2_FULL_41_22]OGJ54358.1 MAG: hypothetical protein A2336_00185 [Candidatus Peregrinibacteria bacterium RIFOXYB2_FULL_41_88]